MNINSYDLYLLFMNLIHTCYFALHLITVEWNVLHFLIFWVFLLVLYDDENKFFASEWLYILFNYLYMNKYE